MVQKKYKHFLPWKNKNVEFSLRNIQFFTGLKNKNKLQKQRRNMDSIDWDFSVVTEKLVSVLSKTSCTSLKSRSSLVQNVPGLNRSCLGSVPGPAGASPQEGHGDDHRAGDSLL